MPRFLGLVAVLLLALGCGKKQSESVTCFENSEGEVICAHPDGLCRDRAGNQVCCTPNCDADPDPIDPIDPDDPDPDDPDPTAYCRCPETPEDLDGDCIPNALDPDQNLWDTDGDGIGDGCEDRNRNGVVDRGELDPRNPDTDEDGIQDGIEDANKSGRRDPGETSAINADTDGDGITDGSEDINQNGIVDPWVDVNGNGCWDPGIDTPGEGDPRRTDSDGDGIPDKIEDKNHNGVCDAGETCFFVVDTDCDGIWDGSEDKNRDGIVGRGETDPLNPDTDGDGIPDGVEDSNRDGVYDPITETNPLLPDSDFDGIPDGVEDRNQNGRVDGPTQYDANGCFDPTFPDIAQGETDPRKLDSDGDGIPDGAEDGDHDGYCYITTRPSRLNPSVMVPTFVETCAWLGDTDCDGLQDGEEDLDWSGGATDPGELDPRDRDTDLDGLYDGCLPWMNGMCEDTNNDGIVEPTEDVNANGLHDIGEPGETNPLDYDTDADGLSDGCERNFEDGPTNPLEADTDGDGMLDGDEDKNHNCGMDDGETDPRVADPPPADGTLASAEWNVCGAQNLKKLTFATSLPSKLDYKLAFEVERSEDGASESNYFLLPFGRDNNGNGFSPTEVADTHYGHVFQSGHAVVRDPGLDRLITRQIYGFVVASESILELDDILDDIRAELQVKYPAVGSDNGLEEVSAVTARPAHDSLDTFPVLRAQRQYRVRLAAAKSALMVRNELLLEVFLGGTAPDPVGVPPLIDPVEGAAPLTTTRFSLYIGGVRRTAQLGPNGQPLVFSIVALSPDDSFSSDSDLVRLSADRQSRLEDITGGSAFARTTNGTSSICEKKNVKRAVADLLWVVDDSASMQTIIKRVQTAASDARAVLSANTPIVDFRVAMTTTNPARGSRSRCYTGCDDQCGGGTACDGNCADTTVGCISDPSPVTIMGDASTFPLPGGGGTFYYEDGHLLDCDSSNVLAIEFTNYCLPEYGTAFDPFMNPAFPGDLDATARLLGNRGFIRSVPNTSCSFSSLPLHEKVSPAVSCAPNDPECCPRLTAACADGPQVLESQMCDLIRAMGGLPDPDNTAGQRTGRAHASPEMGTRTLRRLLADMLPAYPANYTGADAKDHLRLTCCSTCDPATDATCAERCCNACDVSSCPASDPNCCSHPGVDGGLDCNISAECVACVPGEDDYCPTVPLVSIVLSDEEDFWFKDECRLQANDATVDPEAIDKSPLPTLCRYVDGDASTLEPCTVEYCEGASFLSGPPSSYNPDFAPYATDDQSRFNSIRQRATGDAACQFGDLGCAVDPCPGLTQQATCNNYSNFYSDARFSDLGLTNTAICTWDGSCRNVCADITKGAGTTTAATRTALAAACNADPRCQWNSGRVTSSSGDAQEACELKLEPNDCRPCKRLRRLQEALYGENGPGDNRCNEQLTEPNCALAFMCEWNGSSCQMQTLPGLSGYGPVYAIVRNAGQQGTGGNIGNALATVDECGGAPNTWGRGDGSAYRDLAIATQGATHNVCANSYKDFMQTMVTNIVALSAPYPLLGSPIASTIKVGRARPIGGGVYQYEEVQRSLSCGFHYNATTNSIGFKRSEPEADCTPEEKDLVIISYRYWLPVPCRGMCEDYEICAQALCVDGMTQPVCAGDGDCPDVDDTCASGSCACTPGTVVDRCVPQACGECMELVYNEGTGTWGCVEIISPPGECRCLPGGTSGLPCTPGGPNVCPLGQRCSEDSCTCIAGSICPGVDFDLNGNWIPEAGCAPISTCASCEAALACCEDWAQLDTSCAALSQAACDTADCAWLLASGVCAPRNAPSPCCAVGEVPGCWLDPETGRATVVCQPPGCVCESPVCNIECPGIMDDTACNAHPDCTWENNRCNAIVCEPFQTCELTATGENKCMPPCVPVEERCQEVGGVCECIYNPG